MSLTQGKPEALDDGELRADGEEFGAFFHLFGHDAPTALRDDAIDFTEDVSWR